MYYLFSLLVLIMAVLLYMMYEARNVKVERIEFTLSKKGLKIIQLSDIHVKFLRVPAATIKSIIDKEKPDIIIMTGDYIEKPLHIEKFLGFLAQISGNIPVFLCLGNHDYRAFKTKKAEFFIKALEENGITVLVNRTVGFKKGNIIYNITGIDDLSEGKPDINKALESASKEAFVTIAISHNPDIVFDIPKGKVDYLFCGHFHGGQIWMPFHLEFRMLRDEKLCKMNITRGLHKVNGINLYINRGLGNVCVPLRFLSKPEITVFHLP